MNKVYTVLKKFGDLKKGDTFDPTASNYPGTEKDIAEAVAVKFIKENPAPVAPTHDELVAKATELEVDFDEDTSDEELVSLIAEKQDEGKKGSNAAPVKPAPKGKITSVTVTWNGGQREYSLDLHGEAFAELAQEFADQYPEAVIA